MPDRLSLLEKKVLKQMQSIKTPCSVPELSKAHAHALSNNTYHTVLCRLLKKGAVVRQKVPNDNPFSRVTNRSLWALSPGLQVVSRDTQDL
jgi:predicted transcriptional regulator